MKIMITGSDGSLGSMLNFNLGLIGHHILEMEKRDASDIGLAKEWLEDAKDEIAELDCLIMNHSVNYLSMLGCNDWDEKIEANHHMVVCNLLVPRTIIDCLAHFCKKPLRVIFIASQTYRVAQRGTSLYCATKAAQVMLMKVTAREMAPKGWVVNALAPGKIVDTEMSRLTDEQVLKLRGWDAKDAERYALSLIPAGRFTNCAEVVDAVMKMLALPDYINGTVIDMTGAV